MDAHRVREADVSNEQVAAVAVRAVRRCSSLPRAEHDVYVTLLLKPGPVKINVAPEPPPVDAEVALEFKAG